MTRDSGNSSSSSSSSSGTVGNVSKSRDGLRPGDPGYQNVTDNTPPEDSDNSPSGTLSLPPSDPTTSNPKTFDVMAPLTFPTSTNAASEGNGGPPALAPTLEPTPIDTTVTPAATDVVTAIASQVGQATPRPAAINNNFTSLASRAGTKRSLIGGA